MTDLTLTVPDPHLLPDRTLTNNGNLAQTQMLTSDNLMFLLESLGIKLRFNVMDRRAVFSHPAIAEDDLQQERVYQAVEDMLLRLHIKALDRLPSVLGVVARQDRYHPMQEMILAKPWDGHDYISDLAASVSTPTKSWPVYLRKWLIQLIQAVRGWEDGEAASLPHVLVFVGGQGMGKGRWVSSLAPGFAKTDAELHLSGSGGKDHQIEVLRHPIAELGEIDSTFRKSEVSTLKSFLSRKIDEIREPYARRAIKHPRSTVFIGTVNDIEFLGDATGSRRFWPVEIDGPLQWDHGIDMQQVFAQANELWCDGEDWNLSREEDARRRQEAHEFTSTPPEVDLTAAFWLKNRDDLASYAILNKTEIMRVCGMRNPSMAAVANVSRWLRDTLGKSRKLQGKYNAWVFPVGDRLATVEGLQYCGKEYAMKHRKVEKDE